MALVKVKRRAQVTLPVGVRRALGVSAGDYLATPTWMGSSPMPTPGCTHTWRRRAAPPTAPRR